MDISELEDDGGTKEDVCRVDSRLPAVYRGVVVDDPEVLYEWMTGKPRDFGRKDMENPRIVGVACVNEDGSKTVIVEDEDTGIIEYQVVGKDSHLGAVRE